MAVQNNPTVSTPLPSTTAADAAARPDAGRPSTTAPRPEGAQPPAGAAHPPAAPHGAAANNLGLPQTQAQLDLANAFDNIQAQQGLIATEVNADAVQSSQENNQGVRQDARESRQQGQQEAEGRQDQAAQRVYKDALAQRSLGDAPNTKGRYNQFLTQGSLAQQTTPRPANPNSANSQQGLNAEQHLAYQQAMAARGDARTARQGQNPTQANPQAQTFRANGTLGYLMPSPTPGGRPVVVIQTRQPTGQANPSDPQNPNAEHTEGQPPTREAGDRALNQFASRQRPVGERRNSEATRETERDHAEGEGEGENTSSRQGDSSVARVVAQYHSGEGGQGGGQQQREASITEARERYNIEFGSAEEGANGVAHRGVLGAVEGGTGTYVRRLAARDHGSGGRDDSRFGSPTDRMMASAKGVYAGRESDMGELRRLSIRVNGEMIDMGSPQGRARFDSICASHPEVREVAMDLVQQRQDFTRHVTANLFNINGGEPAARA